MKTLEERFIEKIDKDGPGGCWIWKASRQTAGYGQFSVNRGGRWKPYGAHRASWEIHHGPIPDGFLVCHTCDVPLCVNPGHLFLGTQAENLADMSAKGRRNAPRGERAAGAKLTDDDVRDIRSMLSLGAHTQKQISEMYDVTDSCISRVKTGARWSHI
tara:strand:+ start:526 stop:999 length:474 start_codon:yes stop_codon:yes gene_type:complete